MEATVVSSVNLQRNSHGFMTLLSWAACEWFLMFLMFVDVALSYLLSRFASYCELQPPCVLCSRFDPKILCSSHRDEISSTVCCRIHDKLSDVRGMCEECIMSIAMQNNSSSESYKLIAGKLGLEFECGGFQSPYSRKQFISSLGKATCSCCHKPLRTKTNANAQRLLQLTPAGVGASRANVKPPLSRVPGRSRRDGLKRIRDKFSGSVTSPRSGNTSEKALSHVGYSQLKITSDSESEVPFSDDDDGSSVNCENIDSSENFLPQCGSENLAKVQSDKTRLMKQIQIAPSTNPAVLNRSVQFGFNKSNDIQPSTSDAFGKFKWEHPDSLPIPFDVPELISLDDFPSSFSTVEVPFGVSDESSKSDYSRSQGSRLDALYDLVSLKVVPPKTTAIERSLQVPQDKEVPVPISGSSDTNDTSVTKNIHLSKSSIKESHEAGPSMPTDAEAPREASDTVSEQVSTNDSETFDKGVKFLPQGLSADYNELQKGDAAVSEGVQVMRSSSPDRNDSGYESAEVSSVSEINGENIVDRLKRQVEHDRRCISSLYKELEEERNASAIATNETMAMITRLQEEKAALHMESLQYLRMMEEQAEYDMDALEKANDLLTEKELELQDMEAELEFYRNNFLDESVMEKLPRQGANLKGGNKDVVNSVPATKVVSAAPSHSKPTQIPEDNKLVDVKTALLELEDEKMYITQCLKNIESKLHKISSDCSSSTMPNGVYSEKNKNGTENPAGKSIEMTEIYHQNEDAALSRQRDDASTSNGSPTGFDRTVDSVLDNHNNHTEADRQKSSMNCTDIDLTYLENEISDLNDRLEALEADHDFLEHAFNSIESGKEGAEFLQEIVCQLQELRRLEFKKR